MINVVSAERLKSFIILKGFMNVDADKMFSIDVIAKEEQRSNDKMEADTS